jgi:hypothetical protein
MDLFRVEGNLVVPTEHALLIYPYSEIWNRDEDPLKQEAKRQFAYIELNMSYKKSNPYKGFAEDVRKSKVLQAIYKEDSESFIEDELIVKGMEVYEELRLEAAPTIQYYLAAKSGAEKMVKWLNDFNMEDINQRTGLPLYKPREITTALKDSYDVMKTLNAMEEKVYEQLFESIKTKGNKETNHFEM